MAAEGRTETAQRSGGLPGDYSVDVLAQFYSAEILAPGLDSKTELLRQFQHTPVVGQDGPSYSLIMCKQILS